MSTTIRMPEVLANVTEAAVQKWLVAPGDTIEVGQPFAEIETEKAVVEYTAETAGTVLELVVAEGDSVDVGAPIAVVGEAGETPMVEEAPAAPAASAPAASVPATPDAPSAPAEVPSAPASAASGGRQFISPLVRRLAREKGISLDGVQGSGPDGRIVRKDLEALIASGGSQPAAATGADDAPRASAPASSAPAASAAPAALPEGAELVPHSRMRATIARRLTESKNQVPHFYLEAECRVDALLDLRKRLNEGAAAKISVNDLVVKAVAGAFLDVPEANRTWTDEGMVRHASVDIGIAVSLDDGLVVPVVRGVEALSVSALGRSIADLAGRAREGGLKPDEMQGGSFSVSNLGMFGTNSFSAIINPPQAGILAVGAARQAPVVVDGALEVGTVMAVTLSADHRAWDGALAARWLAAFQARIENPLTILA
ncbi:pyruvate dehydrogenase E2 component (dihydrolipoamide acetyltransferase) [Microcella alkaliphila]|uniref:Dihydrolipoamide acetyltransferase component of pyruvate dehydrogenase complex n=1 Tax=Microcella alkaliphila TaxID=279828 RepID=A0A4Q7TCC9_9MICO|nr:dihydrolipoamide acetyltransferase family protein [Microcella alkaliphila]RZT57407.1 pyruvate dehydrogenase E2 component (dihydrolipoamide acetyltransferase) [Microcella alkaliphila]